MLLAKGKKILIQIKMIKLKLQTNKRIINIRTQLLEQVGCG